MEIKFENLDFAYNILANNTKIKSPYQEESEETIAKDFAGFNFPPVQLPSPLEKGILIFRRNGEHYSSHFHLESRNSTVFYGLSKTLEKQLGEIWSPMNKEGCGYILNDEKIPEISIISGDKGRDRLICLGSFGVMPRKFGTIEDFTSELTTLEKFTNIFVNACLLSLVKSKKIARIPGHSIYICA